MKTINCAVLNAEIAKGIGKKENDSDLEFYHRQHEKTDLLLAVPKSYPEKINSLLQALHLADCVVLDIEKVDAELGEKIVAIDASGKETGFIISALEKEQLEPLMQGTALEKFEWIQKEELMEKLAAVKPEEKLGSTVVDLDAMFNVRGVGVVALGFVAQGSVKKFQKLKLLPGGVDVLVKSLQVHDKDREEANAGERVGLSIKGVDPENFSRGMVLSESEFEEKKELALDFEKNKYYKEALTEKKQLHLQCRLQVIGCVVKSVQPLTLELSKPIAARKGEGIVLFDLNAKPRIAGKGTVQ